ncbi:MAG: NUDIX hydrolase [Chloroflexota bacterium]
MDVVMRARELALRGVTSYRALPAVPDDVEEVDPADVDDFADLDDLHDDDTEALLVAMDEFASRPAGERKASFNPTLHPRVGHGQGGGRFRTTIDRLIDALTAHTASGGQGDPFVGFDRDQLRRAAMTRGLTIRRGATRDDIRDALVKDLTPDATRVRVTTMPTVVGNQSFQVTYGNVLIGGVHQHGPRKWTAYASNASPGPGLQGGSSATKFTTEKDAVAALVDDFKTQTKAALAPSRWPASPPAQTSSSTPAMSTTTAASIASMAATAHVAKNSTTMSGKVYSGYVTSGGINIGSIHQDASGSWAAVPPSPGGATPITRGHATRKDAILALATAYHGGAGSAASSAPSVSTVVQPGNFGFEKVYDGGGAYIGEFYTNAAGWIAFDGNRQQIFGPGRLGSFATRDDAFQGVVNTHLGLPAVPTAAPAPAAPAVVVASQITTTALPAMSSRPGSASFAVDYAGTDIGSINRSGSSGGWTAFPPTGALWGLQGSPGTGLHFSTKAAAARGLADAYVAARGQPSTLSAQPTIKLRKLTGAPVSGQLSAHSVSVNGTDVGFIEQSSTGSWFATPNASYGLSRLGGFSQRKQAVAALVQATMPTPTPSLTSQASLPAVAVDPKVKDALDVIYGVDPKAKTAARQLAVYGAMRRSHFDSLQADEQSVVLGDLSYIATTSKSSSAPTALKLIDRFTPPGTPAGTVPTQAAIPPVGAVAQQTRVTDPAGQAGLLKMLPKTQRGLSGDGWTRTTSGGTGPWGQYGAAGLMLRHVDQAGVARYLMVERGPRISDPGKWQFPGGAKEEKETFYQGASREVVEELGFKPSDLDGARVHGTHTTEVSSVMVPGLHSGTVPWAYVSVAATVPKQLVPDLSDPHARAETSDAKWMTEAEIADLDRKGKLLKPLAGGQLQQNVMTLFPGVGASAIRPGATHTKPARLTGTPSLYGRPGAAHKASKGRDLIADKAAQDKLRTDVSAVRKDYRGKTADERLAAIGAMQGYDDTPTVAPRAEMDRLLATGAYIEAWRGVTGTGWGGSGKSAAKISEDMRSGVAYYGTGIFGNGYYLATDKKIAQQYADGTKNSLIRILIPKTAKIDTYENAHAGAQQASSSKGLYRYVGRQNMGGGTLHDEGRYAAARGLDGIVISHKSYGPGGHNSHAARPGLPTYNWVNRSVLVIQEADA